MYQITFSQCHSLQGTRLYCMYTSVHVHVYVMVHVHVLYMYMVNKREECVTIIYTGIDAHIQTLFLYTVDII